ncbi:hypothetical protein F3Y22_tig00110485pilonHSYRG00145 [Hibiscus syriacus]|uniref:Uncharacterized protein n=1 Tax=Hibiscus syriacus TaxID=106335 RepID=A0A6A3AGA7_HIBSY|nr:hypothetical protein F3Y22_tig00110485pilonHSYRG00145 [Hibiscus syriacus]
MWLKQTNENKVADHGKSSKVSDFNRISDDPDRNLTRHEDNEADGSLKESMAHRANQLEKKKLQLKTKVLNLEKQQLKWKRRSWKQELKLDKMRLGNKCLKLGNECIAMQLKEKMSLESV